MKKFMQTYWNERIACGRVMTRAEAVEVLIESGWTRRQAVQIQALYKAI